MLLKPKYMNEYVLIQWPESQLIMEYDWFEEEASLADYDKYGSSAFFIPKERWLELSNQQSAEE